VAAVPYPIPEKTATAASPDTAPDPRRHGAIRAEGPAMSGPKQMRLVSFKPLIKGALRGFANIELPNGLKIDDCTVCISNGRAWASLPSKPVLDRDGRHVEKDGKKQYAAILHWPDRETSDRWSEAVVALVRAEHPEAFQ
jgi:hypothetical protein